MEHSGGEFIRKLHGIKEPDSWPEGPPGPRVQFSQRQLDILDEALRLGLKEWSWQMDSTAPTESEIQKLRQLLNSEPVSLTMRQADLLMAGLVIITDETQDWHKQLNVPSPSTEEVEDLEDLLWQAMPASLSDYPKEAPLGLELNDQDRHCLLEALGLANDHWQVRPRAWSPSASEISELINLLRLPGPLVLTDRQPEIIQASISLWGELKQIKPEELVRLHDLVRRRLH